MKNFFILLLLGFGSCVHAQPLLQWAKNIGGARGDEVKVDATGNVYTTGYFAGAADFDPGPGTFFLTADGGGADDAYVSKLDANGNFVWAKQLGGSSTNYSFSIDVDASGNVYTVGYFGGTVDFDPGPGVFNLTTNGQFDVGISKLDANGNFVWAKNIGGASSDLAYSLCLDQSGNICITGNFKGVVDFDPGTATFNLSNGGFAECFILSLNPAGDFLWAKEINGNFSVGSSISKDATGNLLVCGDYSLTTDLDPGVGVFSVTTSGGGSDAFVIKLDAAGNFIWGRSLGGPGSQTCESVKTDSAGNVFLTGYFPLTADFDPGAGVFEMTAAGIRTQNLLYSYLHKMPTNGNNYYRLKLLDIDGRYTYSPIIKIIFTTNDFSVNTFPNPFVDFLQIHVRAIKNETIVLYLHGSDGKIIKSKQFSVVKGSNRFAWNFQSVPAGSYFISSSKN